VPLLLFAIAGARAAERIKAFRTRARAVRTTAGIVMIALAVALVFNLPAIVQRALPDYTGGLQRSIAQNTQLTPNADASNAQLVNCPSGSPTLHECGPAPALNATNWLNTPGNAPIDLASLKGGVTLIDFWTYSCINCQRDVPHVEAWYQAYQKAGLHVIGVHAPEFVFERDLGNIAAGARDLGVTYPIAVDNKLATWTAYRNQYWPALYLIDASGTVRSIHFGEGDYRTTEKLIRQLLTGADPGVALPAPTDLPDAALTADRTPETYLSYVRLAPHIAGDPLVAKKPTRYTLPATVGDDRIGLGGTWTVGDLSATTGAGAQLALNYKAKDAHVVIGGTGIVTVTDRGQTTTIKISGPPRLYDLTSNAQATRFTLTLALTPGLQAYSFTFG
jgi:thiol-disulfide isomerase/thioredoxin